MDRSGDSRRQRIECSALTRPAGSESRRLPKVRKKESGRQARADSVSLAAPTFKSPPRNPLFNPHYNSYTVKMFALRRAAARSFVSSPLKARSFVTQTPTGLRQTQKWQMPVFQRRFASEEASPAQEKTTGETIPTEPTETEQAMKEEAVTSEAQAEQEPNVVEKSVSEVADASEQPSMVEQVKEKVQDAASTVTNAAEGLLGKSARDAAAGTHRDPKPSRILYVGNLFFEVKGADLEREFSSHGEVVNARVAEDARGLSRGFGFVEFKTLQDAENAKNKLNQKPLAGRAMAVQYHLRRESRNSVDNRKVQVNRPSKTLFIGNMSFQMTDKDLNDLFRNITNVLDVRVAVDRRSGQPRGFCHADFIDIPSAEAAKEVLGKKEIYGRQLRVDFSRSPSPASDKDL
ncbi:RNA-binding domain-containing protein [Aureobasidium sp. EXF-10727]|nr:RNA-binding domain-containing protein [Aureobasidium sp. EXF-10727]KAI4729800.1 RNA-binding domain-containing protein [Aureobasidium sp. EXF-10728]